jgi:hypothetical protein
MHEDYGIDYGDMRLRQLLDQIAEKRSALEYAQDTLRLVIEHAGTWNDPDRRARDPAEVLKTILTIAADGASRVRAMRKEEIGR